MTMHNRALVEAMAATGISEEEARAQIDRVFAAIPATLRAGKQVRIEGVCALRAPERVASAGFPPNAIRKQRKVQLHHAAVLEQGEPYVDPFYRRPERSTYGRRS